MDGFQRKTGKSGEPAKESDDEKRVYDVIILKTKPGQNADGK